MTPKDKAQASCTIALLVLIATPFVFRGSCRAVGGIPIVYSEGTRSGVVVKVSQKGIFWRTYEAEFALQSLASQSIAKGWECSTASEEIAKKLQEAERSGQRVTVRYRQPLLAGYADGQSGYVITDVEVAE